MYGFIMKANKSYLLMLTAAVFSVASSGCGNSLTGGPYQTNLTMSGGYEASGCQSASMSMTLSESNKNVTGSGSSSCYVLSLTGTDSGSGQITSVNLILSPVSTYSGSNSQCTYGGNLTYQNNQISGSVTLTSPTSGQSGYGSCPTAVSLTGTFL